MSALYLNSMVYLILYVDAILYFHRLTNSHHRTRKCKITISVQDHHKCVPGGVSVRLVCVRRGVSVRKKSVEIEYEIESKSKLNSNVKSKATSTSKRIKTFNWQGLSSDSMWKGSFEH